MKSIIPTEIIENKIFLFRKRKVMLDSHLAELYGVSTKVLNQAVKRNRNRFPADFMFQLDREEFINWKSQFVTSNSEAKEDISKLQMALNRSQFVTGSQKHRDPKSLPYAFTEQGVAMLSSVLKSKRAVEVNIMIMRTFVKLREIMAMHIELASKIDALETKYGQHDVHIKTIFKIIKTLIEAPEEQGEPAEPEKPPIGF